MDMCTVKFNLNYNTVQAAPADASVDAGGVLDIFSKPKPQRDGYMFSGWFTSPECKPEEEWLFGVKLKSFNPPEVIGAMPVTTDLTLYAGWQQPIHIKDEAGLNAIRNNLKGWYVLDNDIIMSNTPFEPIGAYDPTYEYADAEWWLTGFRGTIDGQGHSIKNLHLTHGPAAFIGLISAAGNCTVTNLILDGTVIEVESPSAYIAPLIGVVRQGQNAKVEVSNCKAVNTVIKADLTGDQFIYSSVSGLVAGMWDGIIANCQADGKIDVKFSGSAKDDAYVGGLLGEGYSLTSDSKADFEINIMTKKGGRTYVGPLQASGTSIDNCQAKGKICICGDYAQNSESTKIYAGGILGSVRYNDVKNSQSDVELSLKNLPAVQFGGVAAEFNKEFGVIGPMVGVTHSGIFDCKTATKLDIQNVAELTKGEVCGEGVPEPLQGWGGMLNYDIKNNHCEVK